MLIVQPVLTKAQRRQAAALAHDIWLEYFPALIGREQAQYMVEKFQSFDAMGEQLAQGYRYFLLCEENEPIGYTGVRAEPDGRLFLSKLYVRSDHRGQGVSSMALRYLEALCRHEGLHSIWLTVNRFNAHTIAVYRHWGFQTVRTQVTDIGNGFIMDDFIMEKLLPIPPNSEESV